jgi:hypothetical protein
MHMRRDVGSTPKVQMASKRNTPTWARKRSTNGCVIHVMPTVRALAGGALPGETWHLLYVCSRVYPAVVALLLWGPQVRPAATATTTATAAAAAILARLGKCEGGSVTGSRARRGRCSAHRRGEARGGGQLSLPLTCAQDRLHNPALAVFWDYWWPLVFLSFPFLGRVWCAVW